MPKSLSQPTSSAIEASFVCHKVLLLQVVDEVSFRTMSRSLLLPSDVTTSRRLASGSEHISWQLGLPTTFRTIMWFHSSRGYSRHTSKTKRTECTYFFSVPVVPKNRWLTLASNSSAFYCRRHSGKEIQNATVGQGYRYRLYYGTTAALHNGDSPWHPQGIYF
jgi:hypothetical protein